MSAKGILNLQCYIETWQMSQLLDLSLPELTELKQIKTGRQVLINNQQKSNDNEEKNKLIKIIRKYRLQQYVNTFRQKIKRNNCYQSPAIFQVKSSNEGSNSFLHIEGVEGINKSVQSFIFAGDIIFSLIVFYISVFQAFLQSFRTLKSSSFLIILLKIIAIMFQFSKIFLKSIKKDIINGKDLNHIDDIIKYSTGFFQLILYMTAIGMIILSIIYPLSFSISVVAFLVATIKLFKIPINLKVLDMHYINSQRKQSYWNLAKIIIFQLIFMHFVAAVLLAMPNLNSDKNWLIVHQLDQEHWTAQYFWGMYWSATLITTTGFGDFVAANSKEALVVAFLELFSSVVLAYNLNLIGTIVMSLRNSDQDLQKKLGIFRRMSRESPVSTHIEQKIMSFINYQKKIHEMFEFTQRQNFLNQLPEQLKMQFRNDVNQTIFRQLPYFGNLRAETLNNLGLQFTTRVCYPSENLIPCRQQSNTILILRKGSICFQYHKFGATFMNGCIIQSIQSKDKPQAKPILLNNTFMNRSREINFDMIADDYSLIMTLSQPKFMETIRQSSIQTEHFFTIYDKHESSFIFQGKKCPFCTNEYHNKFQCSKLHYIPFKSQIIQKYLLEKGKKQDRIRYLKTVQRKEHCYYLRRNYYQPYEGYLKVVNKNSMNSTMLNRLIRMKTLAEQYDSQDLLSSFENIFRKIISEGKKQAIVDHGNIEVDILHDYLSYFSEGNPKEFDMRGIKRKTKGKQLKLKHKLTMLASSSRKHLYRSLNEQNEEQQESFLKPIDEY